MKKLLLGKNFWSGPKLDICLLLLLSFLLLSPILFFPHWGLFSDYMQMLRWPASVFNLKTGRLDKIFHDISPDSGGRFFPLFLLENLSAYCLFGAAPFGYYFLQWLMLGFTLVLAYHLTYELSERSRRAGWCASLLILFSEPLFENFFTLDKVEPRLAFSSLLSLTLFFYSVKKNEAQGRLSFTDALFIFFGQFFLAALSIFSKETGVYLVAASFLTLVFSFFVQDKIKAWKPTLLFFLGTLTAWAAYKVAAHLMISEEMRLYFKNGGAPIYTSYHINAKLVRGNFFSYLKSMHDTFAMALVFCLWFFYQLLSGRFRFWSAKYLLLFAVGISGCIYTAGILLWRWACIYYLFPSVVLFSIVFAALCFGPFQTFFLPGLRLRFGPFLMALTLLLSVSYLPFRFYTGAAIFAEDALKDQVVAAIKNDPSHKRIALAFFNFNAIEIGVSLESYLRLNGVTDTKVFNFMDGPWTNYFDFSRYSDSAAETPTLKENQEALQLHFPFVLWRYSPNWKLGKLWEPSPLQPGDLIALPVGSQENSRRAARGVSTFSCDDSFFLDGRLADLGLTPFKQIRIFILFTDSYLGWDFFEVTQINENGNSLKGLNAFGKDVPASQIKAGQIYLGDHWRGIDWANSQPVRWANNNAEIFLPGSEGEKVIWLDLEKNGKFTSDGSLPVNAVDDQGKLLASWTLWGRTLVELPIPDYGGKDHTIFLRAPAELHLPENIYFIHLNAIGWKNDSLFYTRIALLSLNPKVDVLETDSKWVQFGYGWDIGGAPKKNKVFRLLRKSAEILTHPPAGTSLRLTFDFTINKKAKGPLYLQAFNEIGKEIGRTDIFSNPKWILDLPPSDGSLQKFKIAIDESFAPQKEDSKLPLFKLYHLKVEIMKSSPQSL